MSEEKKLKVVEYFDWVALQNFANSQEHHEVVSREEQEFLQYVIYPMFYKESRDSVRFKTYDPFPLIIRTSNPKDREYVIDTDYFTIAFFKYDNYDDEEGWNVSVHIKDYGFCEEPVKAFKEWYGKYYATYGFYEKGVAGFYDFPALDPYSDTVEDFSIVFWNNHKDFLLFRMLDLFRLF